MYRVQYSKQATNQLKKLDKHTASMILGWIKKNLDGCSDPRVHGKGLTANRSGEWRYRIGDYRVLAEIKDDVVIIYILQIGHRRDIYK